MPSSVAMETAAGALNVSLENLSVWYISLCVVPVLNLTALLL